MPRLPRIFIENQPQHIIQRGNNRALIFEEGNDYSFYLECLQIAAETHELYVHSYVLMSNHVHILASPQHQSSIAKVMQSIGRKYVQYFNFKYERTGTLWEGRYRATLIDSEHYLLTCMRYIELNPVRAQIVLNPKAYTWSSYHFNALGAQNDWLIINQLYRRLGKNPAERQKAYRALFRQHISSQTIDEIRSATNKAWVLGSDRFKKKVEKMTSRRAAPLKKGRPKKS